MVTEGAQCERVILALVEIPIYGKQEQAEKVVHVLDRELKLQFSTNARVKTFSVVEVESQRVVGEVDEETVARVLAEMNAGYGR